MTSSKITFSWENKFCRLCCEQ